MRAKITSVIAFSFLVAVTLSIVPMPIWTEGFRPAWVVLLMIYWIIVIPTSVSLGGAWVLGLLLDMLNGTLLGEHAMAMCIVAYLSLKFQRQLRVFPFWQQTLGVFLLIGIYQFI